MRSKNDKFLVVVIILIPLAILFIAGVCLGYDNNDKNKNFQNNVASIKNTTDITSINTITNTNPDEKNAEINEHFKDVTISDSINLDVPFITQAPFRGWAVYPFNHTCEEASVLMVQYYLSGKINVNESITKQELLHMVNFENEKYGFSDDTDTAETAQLIRDYYGYDVRIVYNPSIEDIKKEIASGNPVIVPTAGRLLGNPYFTPPGPLYHMLVIKGYDPTGFITNDPGTYRVGADYKYSYEVLYNAIRDFDLKKTGNIRGAMIVVTKNNP